jgi:hypothetical protein
MSMAYHMFGRAVALLVEQPVLLLFEQVAAEQVDK